MINVSSLLQIRADMLRITFSNYNSKIKKNIVWINRAIINWECNEQKKIK